jgi:hypothetical protein
MRQSESLKERRIGDPYLDRRSGIDRREHYDLDFFLQDGIERRNGIERRRESERRAQWVKVSQWSSICLSIKSPVGEKRIRYL